MTEWLTHRDIAAATGLAEATVKGYRARHPDWLAHLHHGKPLRFAPEAVAICRHIQAALAAGATRAAVEASLADAFPHARPARPAQPAQSAQSTQPLRQVRNGRPPRNGRQPASPSPESALATPERDLLAALLAAQEETNRRLDAIQTLLERMSAATAPRPGRDDPGEIWTLPLAVRNVSPSGEEFLGVAGRQEGPFTLADLAALLPPDSLGRRREGDAWRVELRRDGAPLRARLLVSTARTPRGNRVALLEELERDGLALPPASFYVLVKQLREERRR